MQVFINEKSLHGQYTTHNIETEIKGFLSALTIINELELEKRILTTKHFFYSSAINGVHLDSILNTNKQLKAVFLNNVKNFSFWEDTIEHDTSLSYTYNGIDYVTYTIAEISERKIRSNHLKAFLLNFSLSLFNEHSQIIVVKSPNTSQSIDCAFSKESVLNWLIANDIINPNLQYSERAKTPPKDFQTILANTELFEPTNFYNHGRKVYRRIGHKELWVVDNLHFGKEAHIEVFDESTTRHLGVSVIDKIDIDPKYKIEKRKISI